MARRQLLVTLALLVTLSAVACTNKPAPRAVPEPVAPATSAVSQPSPTPVPFSFAIDPAPGATNLPISAEIGIKLTGGKVTAVGLADGQGRQIAGGLRDDGSSWIPAKPLDNARTYTATVTATSDGGRAETRTTTFTTMGRPGGGRVGSGLYLFDGATYGTAMPVVVEFESDVPEQARAAVARRLLVRTEPAQPGRWAWASARMVQYRAENYWKPGTTISVRAALAGLPIGDRFGDTDRSATAHIAGRSLVMDVDNATKQLTVTQDGQVVRTMPVSLGKPSTPSSSGHLVVMEKAESTVFDTTATDGPNGYRINIDYAQRLTWKGEYIHSASWSVRDQGVRNVSHGCVNLAPANALWLFQQTLIGDAVIVKGTERALQSGNGWTAWDLPWDRYGV
jgi:lipoprotein-anchoring transpeptidase ErfK/SrfK